MKTIAHIVLTGEFSGAEKIAMEICDYTKDEYISMYICKAGSIVNELEKKNIKYKVYRNIKDLIFILRNNDFDLIHAHDYTASVISSFFSKTKVISHIHCNAPFASKFNLKSILYLLAIFKVEKVICVSKIIIEEMYFKNIIKSKSSVIYNWINPNERIWKENLEKSTDILFVGRFNEVKDPLFFLEVVAEVIKSGFNNICVKMVGRGELKKEILDFIKMNNLGKNIEVLGFTDIPHKYMKESKIFFVPSKWEGFGMVFLEAILNDCIVFSRPVGGLKEVLSSNEYLLNNKDEFVEAIKDILLKNKVNKVNKVKVVKKREILETYNIDKSIKRIKEIYKNCLLE